MSVDFYKGLLDCSAARDCTNYEPEEDHDKCAFLQFDSNLGWRCIL